MRILEVKNNLVKISFNADEHLVLSGFVIIEDENMPYVAQVVNLKADDTGNYAIVKLLFTFNSDGIVSNYDGSIPSLDAIVTLLPSEELLDILPVNNPLKLGVLAQQAFILNLDQTLLKKDLIICSDKNDNTSILVNNIIKQLQRNNQKIIVCDTDDSIEHEDKFIFTEDFKLPLNYDTINYIWENDLTDVDATSKAVIQDIFLEVQEYAKTAPHKFIPFDTFIDVVNSQYEETNITELVLLKNKLLKYAENNVFANHHTEFESLTEFLQKNISTVIDLSPAINSKLQKQVIEYIYEVMHSLRETIIAITPVNNANSDKKLLKLFYAPGNVFTTVVCSHEYKHITELKQIARNMILFQPMTVQHDFAGYNTYLNKLNPDEFIVYGELTQNIPLIVQSMQLEALDTLERKLAEEKRLAEEKQKEFEQAQAELKAASKPIMTPFDDNPFQEHNLTEEEQPADTSTEFSDFTETEEAANEELPEPAEEPLQIVETDGEINEEISEEPIEKSNEFIDFNEPYQNIVVEEEEQPDGTELQEEVLPPDAEMPAEPVTDELQQEEITIEEPLPENPYQNIFDEQNPFPDEVQPAKNDEPVIEPITDNAARDVDQYIIYNDKKDEIPSIDEVIAREEQEKLLHTEEEYPAEVNNDDRNAQQTDIQFNDGAFAEEDNSAVIIEGLPQEESEAENFEKLPNITEEEELPPQHIISEEISIEDEPQEFTTIEEFPHQENKYVGLDEIEPSAPIQTEDALTEDDLNFIDELNLDTPQEQQQEDNNEQHQLASMDELDEITNDSQPQNQSQAPIQSANRQEAPQKTHEEEENLNFDEPQIVPIYPADDNENIDIVEGSTETFEQGDKVSHPKYGIGIVEKMIKYGNKTLCSINFENVGRRLLDPAISEISKA